MNVLTVLVFSNERGRLVAELNVKPHVPWLTNEQN